MVRVCLCAALWTVWAEQERERGDERERARGSHNTERHLANKGRNNNSTAGSDAQSGAPFTHTAAQRHATTRC